jgi:transposase InsO family protein
VAVLPWKETDVMKEKEGFFREMLEHKKPFKALCEEYGISEKTGYKWKKRYEEDGKRGLAEKSRAPVSSPNRLDEDTVINIMNLKTVHSAWGPKKLVALYPKIYPGKPVPSLSSTKRVLDKAQMTKKRKVKRMDADHVQRLRQYIQPKECNDVWAIDFKGWWVSDGEKCEPLTIRDLISKKLLAVRLMRTKEAGAVKAVMEEVFREYGLPKVIRSDNGTPFCASHGVLSLTKLSAWWITLGILPDRTDKGSPGQNGSLERMHADIAAEIEGKIPGGIAANQAFIDAWVEEYNAVRPNEAIGMQTPNEVYRPSARKYTGDYDTIEYPPGVLPRKVYASGEVSVFGVRVSVSTALCGLTLGLRPLHDKAYQVFLGDFLLGTADFSLCCFSPLETI